MFSPAPGGTELPAGLGRPVAAVRFLEQVGGLGAPLPRLLVAAGSTSAHFSAADARMTILSCSVPEGSMV